MVDCIQKICMVMCVDVMVVFVVLEDVIMEVLEGGEIVRFVDLGIFQIGLSGRGVEMEDMYDVLMIRKVCINFCLGIVLSGILVVLKYMKVDKLLVKMKGE